jgi:hypothetical protein
MRPVTPPALSRSSGASLTGIRGTPPRLARSTTSCSSGRVPTKLDAIPAVLAVVVLQVVTELLVGRNYALALLFITPMAMLMGQIAAPARWCPFCSTADRRP